jgi:hypothetical protein
VSVGEIRKTRLWSNSVPVQASRLLWTVLLLSNWRTQQSGAVLQILRMKKRFKFSNPRFYEDIGIGCSPCARKHILRIIIEVFQTRGQRLTRLNLFFQEAFKPQMDERVFGCMCEYLLFVRDTYGSLLPCEGHTYAGLLLCEGHTYAGLLLCEGHTYGGLLLCEGHTYGSLLLCEGYRYGILLLYDLFAHQ